MLTTPASLLFGDYPTESTKLKKVGEGKGWNYCGIPSPFRCLQWDGEATQVVVLNPLLSHMLAPPPIRSALPPGPVSILASLWGTTEYVLSRSTPMVPTTFKYSLIRP